MNNIDFKIKSGIFHIVDPSMDRDMCVHCFLECADEDWTSRLEFLNQRVSAVVFQQKSLPTLDRLRPHGSVSIVSGFIGVIDAEFFPDSHKNDREFGKEIKSKNEPLVPFSDTIFNRGVFFNGKISPGTYKFYTQTGLDFKIQAVRIVFCCVLLTREKNSNDLAGIARMESI